MVTALSRNAVWSVSPHVSFLCEYGGEKPIGGVQERGGSAFSLIVSGPRGSRGVLRRMLGMCAWRLLVLDATGRTDVDLVRRSMQVEAARNPHPPRPLTPHAVARRLSLVGAP